MVWTLDRNTPRFLVTAITAPTRFLSNEEGDIMVSVIASMEAP
jgi:hypothetical protein